MTPPYPCHVWITCYPDKVYVSGLGWLEYDELNQKTKDKLAVLSVLDEKQSVTGVGYRVSDKTFRTDWEDSNDFYYAGRKS